MGTTYFPRKRYTDVAAWNQDADSVLNPTYMTSASAEGFWLEAEALELNGVRLAVVKAAAHVVERTRALVVRDRDPSFTLSLQLLGTSRLTQADRVSEVDQDDVTITDSSQPYRRVNEDVTAALVIVFPQQLLNLPPASISTLIGSRISGREGVGAIVAGFMRSVANNLAALQTPMGLSIVHSLIDLTTTLMADVLTSSDAVRSMRDIEMLMSVRRYIMEHLADPDLDPTQIANAHHISVRQLHVIFQRLGVSVSSWVRGRRLEMCRRDLADVRYAGTSIRTVAERWGFSSPTTFARVFTEAYGASPREYRKNTGGER